MSSILKAMKFMHSKKIIHGKFDPCQVRVKNNIYVNDFG